MVKDIQVLGKLTMSDWAVGVDVNTGMGVVVNSATAKTMKLPAAAVDGDFYVVDKERVATGINAAYTNLPDSFAEFNQVKANEKCELVKYAKGSIIAVDQIADATNFVNTTYVKVNTNGAFSAVASASKLQYMGTTACGATTLYKILFLD